MSYHVAPYPALAPETQRLVIRAYATELEARRAAEIATVDMREGLTGALLTSPHYTPAQAVAVAIRAGHAVTRCTDRACGHCAGIRAARRMHRAYLARRRAYPLAYAAA